MAGTKEFFDRLVRTYGAAFATRWRLKAESLAPCERRLGASRQDRAPLRFPLRFSVHTTQQKLLYLRRTSELSLLFLRENHVPVIPISFRNGFLAFAPTIAGG